MTSRRLAFDSAGHADGSWSVVQPFPTSADAVAGELRRLALAIRHRWRLQRALRASLPKATFEDVDTELAVLAVPTGHSYARDSEPEVVELEKLARAEDERCRNARAASQQLALYRLAARAGLGELELELFLLALAAEIDEGFGRTFLHMRQSVTGRRTINVGTAAQLLTPDDPGGGRVRAAITSSAPLVRLGLVELLDAEGGEHRGVSLRTLIAAPSSVVLAVLEQAIVDETLGSWVTVDAPALPRDKLALDPAIPARVHDLLGRERPLILVEGVTGVGKRALVRSVAAERGGRLVEASVHEAPQLLSASERAALIRLVWLLDATLLLRVAPHAQLEPPPGVVRPELDMRRVSDLVDRAHGAVIITRPPDSAGLELSREAVARPSATLGIPLPSVEARAGLWAEQLGPQGRALDVHMLAAAYTISGGEIVQAASVARRRASGREENGACTLTEIVDAIDLRYAARLQKAGRRLPPSKLALHEIALAPETRETLTEFQDTIRLRHKVLDKGGFGRLVRSRGVSAVFYGEPGTGKTLTASSIAAACGLALYQVDISQLVSKWVGETEKNLEEVFRAAEAGHAMLLFDEADAIFGKRTDVKNSNDRYANMQTNFLLSRIEVFNGVTILTTNRDSAIDAALMRRLTFRVYFPMPEHDERVALWRTCLAGQALDHVDLDALAGALEMSGGYIRNAAVRGAYLAAVENSPLTTDILLKAAKLVLRDAGKVV